MTTRPTTPVEDRIDTSVFESHLSSSLLAEVEAEKRPFLDTPVGSVLLGLIPIILLLGLWAFVSDHRPQGWLYIVPKFGDTIDTLYDDLFVTHAGLHAARETLKEALLGFAVASVIGIVTGTLIGVNRILEAIFYPLILAFNSVPKIALAPFSLLIFGFGTSSKVALAAALALFPILVNTEQGMKQIRLDEIDLLRSLEASSWQTFRKVRLPRAFPSIVTGLQIGLILALIGAVVGELLGGEASGLGYLVSVRSSRLDIPGMYSAFVVLGIVGVSLSLIVLASNRLLANWKES